MLSVPLLQAKCTNAPCIWEAWCSLHLASYPVPGQQSEVIKPDQLPKKISLEKARIAQRLPTRISMATAFNHYQAPERGLVHFVLTNLFPTKTGEESLDKPSRSNAEGLGKEAMVNEDSIRVEQPVVKEFACRGQGKSMSG